MTVAQAEPSPGQGEPKVSAAMPCRVAGIGASAGGIEAISQLLAALPADLELALVVVLHLDPTHESSLVELLSRTTKLTVEVASSAAPVRPGHVYVIPPNANLTLAGGRLALVQRTASPAPHLPVDQLFASLAEELGDRAIGVVLSGTGSDGTLGSQAIKRAAGVTFAQDASARFDGMPTSAVASGAIDAVLSPPQIAQELARLSRLAPEPGEPPSAVLLGDDRELRQLFVALREKIGVDFSGYKPSTLRRRLERRLVRNRMDRLSEYLELLEQSPIEARALYEELLIHVTGFFRDPSVFETLRLTVLPRLLEKRRDDAPIRVWVPGCSSGEEVYSLAICLLEALSEAGRPNPIKLFGTDVSDAAIERARAGIYPESIAADISPTRLKRFFLSTGSGFQIRPDIRDMCVFARQDVASDPPFSNMDLISCRNLLIYLGQGLQGRVIAVLHYALRDNGYLVLGTSESISTFPGFSLVDSKNRIFAKVPGTGRLLLDFPGRWPSAGRLKLEHLPAPTSPLDLNKEVERAVLARFGAPSVVVTEDLTIVQFRGQTGPFLDPLPGTASLDLFRLAREEIRMELRGAIDEARQSGEPTRRTGLWLRSGKGVQRLTIEVIRVPVAELRYFLILFQIAPIASGEPGAAEAPTDPAKQDIEVELRRELASTREYLRSVIEQLEASNEELRAANEEVVSSNEELLSTNEELQTAKEELQATNEELTTVNEEVLQRNVEASRTNTDLMNVLSSVEIPIVLLGRGARVRRFTPAAGRLLHLIATDIGRPLTDLKPQIHLPDLERLINEVLENESPQRREVQDDAGHWYEVVVRPYVTLDDRQDGAVVSILDIDALKVSQLAVIEARDVAESKEQKLKQLAFETAATEERERRRIAADIHDRIGQALALVEMKLNVLREALGDADGKDLDDCRRLVVQSIADARTLSFELSPPILYDLGLEAAVSWLSDQMKAEHGLEVHIEDDGQSKPLGETTAALLFRAIRELLMNVLKHARTRVAWVSLRREGEQLVVEVRDEGVGFDLDHAQPGSGFGLFNVRERITRLGGSMEVSALAGHGARVTLRLPLQATTTKGSDHANPAGG